MLCVQGSRACRARRKPILSCLILGLACARLPAAAAELLDRESARLTPSLPESNGFFGVSVATYGNGLVIVGAPGMDGPETDSGAAFVYARNHGGMNAWGLAATLTASDGATGDQFGASVTIRGDTAAVGSALHDDGLLTNAGSAYVFQRDQGGPGAWGQVKAVTPTTGMASVWFGLPVSLAGDTLAVGASGDDDRGTDAGAVYVFERHQGGLNNWGQAAKISAADGDSNDWFGLSVAVDGDTLVAGAWHDSDGGEWSGAAYVFDRHHGGSNNWGQVKKLTAANADSNDWFGNAVAVSGDTIAIGAHGDDDQGGNAGAVYIFERNEGGPTNWGQAAKVIPVEANAGDFFGLTVAISGDTMVAGALRREGGGAAYVFERNEGGSNNWGEVWKLVAGTGGTDDAFARSVAVAADVVLVGADRNDSLGYDAGTVHLQDLASPRLRISPQGPDVALQWRGREGWTYSVHWAATPEAGWNDLAGFTGLSGSNGLMNAVATWPPQGPRVYRVRAER